MSMVSASVDVGSSSSPKYDVFISFRGPDTRQSFTSHLHAALCRKNIYTFIDDGLRRGDPISTLFPIIENSKFSLIIFSQDYASSDWCLNELVKILECRQTRGQVVLPVFYNVDPSNVRNQTGSYAESFVNHDREQTPAETIQKWRNALREAAALSGWKSAVTRPDALLTEEIAKDVWKRLYRMSSIYDKDLVGIDSKVEEIESMLCFGSDDLCVVGIWGIGGIGKTTLAQATFDKLFSEFENAYFIKDVRENSETRAGLSNMREKLFSSMLGGNGKATEYISNFVLARLCRQKVIIVFDDVSDSLQVESIIGPFRNWSNTGSRFIVTSRDKQVLRNLCNNGKIYELTDLLPDEALKLFCRYAFKQEFPVTEHMELSRTVLEYTKGVPLALKVLGSFLDGKSNHVWESEIQKLERAPQTTIQNVLKISFEGLEDDQKKIFLDIGCFFQGGSRDFLVKYFDACDFMTETELVVLIDRCLIYFSSYNEVRMHDLLRGMCREIVRQESINDPGNRTRLWHPKDIYKVFKQNTGTQRIEGISLNMSMIDGVNLQKNVFEKMKNLRLLKFYHSLHEKETVNKVHVPQGLDFVLNELRYLQWDGYPMKSLKPYFILENLVDLVIRQSNINQLWDGVQLLRKLRNIELIHCEELTTIPDLLGADSLKQLCFGNCLSLRSVPSCAHLKFMKELVIEFCPKLDVIPDLPHNLENLWLWNIGIEELPSFIGDLYKLKELIIRDCSKLKCLPYSFRNLRSLYLFEIKRCKKLDKLPHDLGDIQALERLKINHTAVEVLPSSICKSTSLQYLDVSFNRIARLPRYIGDLKSLVVFKASCNPIEELPSSIGHLYRLQCLTLCRAKLKCLPSSISKLKSLEVLLLCGNEELENQTTLESLRHLQVNDSEISEQDTIFNLGRQRCSCHTLETNYKLPQYFSPMDEYEVLKVGPPRWLYDAKLSFFSSSISKLKSLVDSNGSSFRTFKVFRFSEALGTVRNFSSFCSHINLQILNLSNCGILELPRNLGELSSLRILKLSSNKFENLPASIINLYQLESLIVRRCHKLKTLPKLPRNLEVLDASGCSSLENLPSLSVLFSNIKYSDNRIFLLECFKLDKNSLRAVIEDALLKSSQVVYSKEASVVYPGFEIPEWFVSQSVGSLITLELPLGCCHRKISGISLCAVVNFPCSNLQMRYKFEREDGQFEAGEKSLANLSVTQEKHDGYHVCITNRYFNGSLCQLQSATVSFGFYVERHDDKNNDVRCFDATACGIRFLYDENLRKRHRNSHSNKKEQGSRNKRARG